MANINDFKIVNARSIRKFKQATQELNATKLTNNLDETNQARIGFYYLTLEVLTGNSDYRMLDQYIIDSKYNETIHEKGVDDLGIDAVFIDETDGNHTINLFTYKFRGRFNPDKTQGEEALLKSNKFLSYIQGMEVNDDVKNTDEKVRNYLIDIIDKLQTNTPWEIILYSISNENHSFDQRLDPIIRNLQKNMGLSIKSITLDDITGFFSDRKRNKECTFAVSKEDILMYKTDEQVTDCSYVIRMNLIDVIRICCNDDELANKYSAEDDSIIKDAFLEKALLFDNIRGYLGETNYNSNIKTTIIEEPQNFFMFNNGLTITTSFLDAQLFNSGTKMKFVLKDYQLVNGGQTINTIFQYLQSSKDDNKIFKLRQASVLVRIFKVSDNSNDDQVEVNKQKGPLKNRIAEYTNSQNSINPQDLKSVSSLQILIQQYLEQKDIEYIRKAGIETNDKQFRYRITMDQLTKLLYSRQGYPERVTNQKRKLYTDYYDSIYTVGENGFNFEEAYDIIRKYFSLRQIYTSYTEQRIFYLIYLIYNYDVDDKQADSIIKDTLEEYDYTYPARALIQKGFKVNLDNNIKNKLAITV